MRSRSRAPTHRGALGDLERLVRDQLVHRPYAALTAASGLGYVLGGGVPVALGRMMVGMGGRLAFVMMAQRLRDGLLSSTTVPQEKEKE